MTGLLAAFAALAPSGTAGAASPNVAKQRLYSGMQLTQMGYPELDGWEADDHLSAFKTFLVSCERLLKLAHERTGGKVRPSADLAHACDAALKLPSPVDRASARAYFEAHFTPFAIVHMGRPGLLTGYYEPILRGSRTAHGRFQHPIYRRPPELATHVETTNGKPGSSSPGQRLPGTVKRFYTRAEIEQGALKGRGLELLYFDDPVEVFFMHIQGSARVQLEDGSTVRVGFSGKNGHPYASIGHYVVEKGLMPAEKVSLEALRVWLSQDRTRGQQVMWQNPSFIFFKETGEGGDQGPLGALGVPLTAGRSLAIDPGFHRLGMPIFVTGQEMRHVQPSGTFARLMIAQDVGSAIKGPERGDLYFGSGEEAGKLAGITRHRGNFAVLLPNPVAGEAPRRGAKP